MSPSKPMNIELPMKTYLNSHSSYGNEFAMLTSVKN